MAISNRQMFAFRPPEWMRNWLIIEKKNGQFPSYSSVLEDIIASHIRGDQPSDQIQEKLAGLESQLANLQHQIKLIAQAMVLNARTSRQRDIHQLLRDVVE